MAEDMGLALRNHQLEADNDRLQRANQELRHEHGELERWATELKIENDQARVLLEAIPEPVYESEAGYTHCTCCAGEHAFDSKKNEVLSFQHMPDCPWLKIRAFLAQRKEAPDAGS